MIQILLCSFGYILLLNKPDQNLVTWDNSSCSFCFYIDNLAIIQLDSSFQCFVWTSDFIRWWSLHFKDASLTWLTFGTGFQLGAQPWLWVKRASVPPLFGPLHWLPGYLTRVRVSKDRHAGSHFLRSGSGNWHIISAVNYWSNSYRFKG